MAEFEGFPAEGLQFLADLAENNEKAWFDEHKETYIEKVRDPALIFVEALGERLKAIEPRITIDTRTNGAGSLMRIYRDVRFSQDKSPYKTNVGIVWWVGPGKKLQHPSYYFHLDPDGAYLHAGQYQFPKETLERFRQAVDDEERGRALREALGDLEREGYEVGGERYKRVPRGYEKDHPRAELLKRKGLTVTTPDPLPEEVITSPRLVDVCFKQAEEMAPVFKWLVEMDQRA